MIHVSENAATQIKTLKTNQPDGAFIRVKVTKGGCSGLSYKLDFDTETSDKDKHFDEHGVKVVIDQDSYLYLIGTTLDFDGGLNGQGFTFNNPNASKSCGCGASFNM